MQKRIEEIENRFDLIESQLKDPEISADYSKIQKLLKEHNVRLMWHPEGIVVPDLEVLLLLPYLYLYEIIDYL